MVELGTENSSDDELGKEKSSDDELEILENSRQ